MTASENRFAPELNEKKVIELLENAKPGCIKANDKLWHENISCLKLQNFIFTI